ncbi:MAG: tetratricopeptide repeat protein [Candidatus Paceibacterota bacterium]
METKEADKKTTRYYFLWQMLTEFLVIFVLLTAGLIIEVLNRQLLFFEDGTLNTTIVAFIIQQTLLTASVSVVFYKFIKISSYSIVMSLSKRLVAKEEDKILVTLFDVFIILAVLLPTMMVRPIIHQTYLDSDIENFTYDYAQFDALFSVALLSMVAIPLIYVLYRKKEDLLRWLKIWGVIIIIVIVGYMNSFGFGNFYTRILESSASWVKQDWVKQSDLAHKALRDAETDFEKASAYYWMGVAENRQGNFEEAAQYQLQALELEPEYAAAHASLANAYTFSGKHEQSLYHAQKCREFEPQYAWCYQAMSNHFWTIGDTANALRYARLATELDPTSRELKKMYLEILDYSERQ